MESSDASRSMYRWRRLTPKQREQTLRYRRASKLPLHSPPHYASDTSYYLLTAACYEHRPFIGHLPERMATFEESLLVTLSGACNSVFAWTILPNHYHVLLQTPNIKRLLFTVGQLHGRSSYEWNGAEQQRGRTVWCNAAETAMKSERHFWATLLYVLNNAVRHGYVQKWQEWPFSNAATWLDEVGQDRAEQLWREFPIDEYGQDWDPPDL